MTARQWPDPDEVGWPPTDGAGWSAGARLFEARLDARKKRIDADIASTAAYVNADIANEAAFHRALVEASRASAERARRASEGVQKAAGAIITLYTALLALVFSVDGNLLPGRALLPAAFLGGAIVLSAVHAAYLTKPADVPAPGPMFPGPAAQATRTVAFIQWISAVASARAYWLRASVIALGVGVVLLPSPFVSVPYGEAPTSAELTAARDASNPWPPLPRRQDAVSLELYEAQVAEVARLRARQVVESRRGSDEEFLVGAGGLGLLAVFGLAFVGRLRPSPRPSGGAGPGTAAVAGSGGPPPTA